MKPGGSMEVIGVSRVVRSKIWLPKEVRRRLNLSEGDMVYFYVNEKEEVVVKKSERSRFKLG